MATEMAKTVFFPSARRQHNGEGERERACQTRPGNCGREARIRSCGIEPGCVARAHRQSRDNT
jgi:hypothetical protein